MPPERGEALLIHPENADRVLDQLFMLIADLGEAAASLAALAPDNCLERLERLRQLGRDQAVLAEAAQAVLRNRAQPVQAAQ